MISFREFLALLGLCAFILGAAFLISEVAISGSWQTWLRQYLETGAQT